MSYIILFYYSYFLQCFQNIKIYFPKNNSAAFYLSYLISLTNSQLNYNNKQ